MWRERLAVSKPSWPSVPTVVGAPTTRTLATAGPKPASAPERAPQRRALRHLEMTGSGEILELLRRRPPSRDRPRKSGGPMVRLSSSASRWRSPSRVEAARAARTPAARVSADVLGAQVQVIKPALVERVRVATFRAGFGGELCQGRAMPTPRPAPSARERPVQTQASGATGSRSRRDDGRSGSHPSVASWTQGQRRRMSMWLKAALSPIPKETGRRSVSRVGVRSRPLEERGLRLGAQVRLSLGLAS